MKASKRAPLGELWALSLILGLGLLNFPFVEIFNTDRPLFGIPLLVLYFYCGWLLIIAVIYLFARRLQQGAHGDDEGDDHS